MGVSCNSFPPLLSSCVSQPRTPSFFSPFKKEERRDYIRASRDGYSGSSSLSGRGSEPLTSHPPCSPALARARTGRTRARASGPTPKRNRGPYRTTVPRPLRESSSSRPSLSGCTVAPPLFRLRLLAGVSPGVIHTPRLSPAGGDRGWVSINPFPSTRGSQGQINPISVNSVRLFRRCSLG